MDTVDRRAAELGARQLGLATRRQLTDEAGISARTLRRRLRSGSWRAPLPTVVDLRTHQPTWERSVLQLVLAAGPERAWASHATAAYLHGFLDAPRPTTVDVLVPRGRHALVGGLPLHTTRSIGRDEVRCVGSIPCTDAERTLLDLAATTDVDTLERFALDLIRRRAGTAARLARLLDRHRNAPGRSRLLRALDRLPADAGQLESPLEVLGVQRLRRLGAPTFILQNVVRDEVGDRIRRVDVAWPSQRAAVEFDGAAYHDLTTVRAQDAEQRERLRACGWRVLPVRRDQLKGPALAAFVDELRAAAASPAAPTDSR